MTKELGALLRKKSWTGDEIGKAILYSLVDAHRQALQGVANPAPVFSPDQLQTMIASLGDSVQLRRYNSYVSLQNWLIQYQAVSTAYLKQAAGELDVISGVLQTALAVEEDLQTLGKLPVIMTQEQYEELRSRRVQEQLVDAEGRDKTYSVWKLLLLATAYWYMQLSLYPKEKNPLRAFKEEYENDPAACPRVMAAYAGKPYPSKWDMVRRGKLHAYYTPKEFHKEFPGLCLAMLQDMDRALFAGMTSFAIRPPEKWEEPACSVRLLYQKNIYDMSHILEGDRAIFTGDEEVIERGYAIVTNDFRGLVDGVRAFREPEAFLKTSVLCGLEQYTPKNPEWKQAVQRLSEGRKVVEDGYYYVKGYDKAIELIAENLSMPEFTIFQLGAAALRERMEEIDERAAALGREIAEADYGRPDIRQVKQEVLDRYFSPFDWPAFEIPVKAILAAKKLLSDNLRAFDRQDSTFISLLTTREGRA